MMRVILGWAVVAAVAASAVVKSDAPRPRRAPGIVFRVDAEADRVGAAVRDAAADGDDGDDDRAMSLALASLSPADRKKLLDDVSYAATRLEARAVPFDDDLEDGDPLAELREATEPYLPVLTAARAFAGNERDGSGLDVRVVADCDDARLSPGERCAPLWGEDGDRPGEAERARFFAWSASRAAVFDLATPADAIACAGALRGDLTRKDGRLGLVLVADGRAPEGVPERGDLEAAARRLGRAMAANHVDGGRGPLDALARPAPAARVATWMPSAAARVVVVPRLSALARTRDLAVAIAQTPACASPRWVHRP